MSGRQVWEGAPYPWPHGHGSDHPTAQAAGAETDPGLARLQRITAPPCVAVLIGSAGSGKSSLARRAWASTQVLSLDEWRGRVSDDECDQDATGDAPSVLLQILRVRLSRRLTTVIDATNVCFSDRQPLLQSARAAEVPAAAIVLGTSLEASLARNAARPGPAPGARWGRRVPEHVVRSQHRSLQGSLPSLQAEGFARIVTWPSGHEVRTAIEAPGTSPPRT